MDSKAAGAADADGEVSESSAVEKGTRRASIEMNDSVLMIRFAVTQSASLVSLDEVLFHYNLACYECQLWDVDWTKTRLKRACEFET
jgi:hypothetical protein